MNQPYETEIVPDNEMILSGGEAITAVTRAEIDTQVATAKRYPRSIVNARKECQELACLDEETASTMFYSLPRGGKTIQGPSARFAEVVAYSWGNLRYGARVTAIDDTFITAQGTCHDLEKNTAGFFEVKRRITDKYGKRFNDDMITVTGNAACSIAMRNAIFKVIPTSLVKPVYDEVLRLVRGDSTSLSERRDKCLKWFLQLGATQEQVLQAIGRDGVEAITLDDLLILRGLGTAIRDNETSIEEALGPVPDKTKRVKRSDLNEKIEKTEKSKTASSGGGVAGSGVDAVSVAPSKSQDSIAAAPISDRPDGFVNGYDETSEPFTDWDVVNLELKQSRSRDDVYDTRTHWMGQMRNDLDVQRLEGLVKLAISSLKPKGK